MTKKEARQQVKEWMKKLDKNYIEKADQSIFEQVKELKEKGVLIIIASHNKEDIELLSDVKIHMVDGCIKDEKR